MMNEENIKLGIAYAEQNFLSNDSHLKVDKEVIKEKFDLTGLKVLDFGCGMGSMSLWLAKTFGCTVHGIDIDTNHLNIANRMKEKYAFDNVLFEFKNLLESPLTEKYDFIILNDVAEHIPLNLLERILIELKRGLAENGSIFLSYPPWRSPYASHLNHVIALPWCQFLPDAVIFKWLQYKDLNMVGTKDLKQEYLDLNRLTHKKLKRILHKAELKILFRKSVTKFNKISALRNVNINFFPFDFVVTKEFLILAPESK